MLRQGRFLWGRFQKIKLFPHPFKFPSVSFCAVAVLLQRLLTDRVFLFALTHSFKRERKMWPKMIIYSQRIMNIVLLVLPLFSFLMTMLAECCWWADSSINKWPNRGHYIPAIFSSSYLDRPKIRTLFSRVDNDPGMNKKKMASPNISCPRFGHCMFSSEYFLLGKRQNSSPLVPHA